MNAVISITNSKGGVGKSTTALNLGAALSTAGKRVLLIDSDVQGNLTAALGFTQGEQKNTLAKLLLAAIDSPEDVELYLSRTILHTESGLDLIPANAKLSDAAARLQVMQLSQYNAVGEAERPCEKVMSEMLEHLRSSYDYDEVYGSRYNYGGKNVSDYQIPELPYGTYSNTSIGVMEKVRLPGQTVSYGGLAVDFGGISGAVSGNAITVIPSVQSVPVYEMTAYTSAADMVRSDGSIGTLKIPSLGINMKVWEGETDSSMAKGIAHYSTTTGWDGNIGLCGHNRGTKYAIGSIKDLKIGDTITYTTVCGTRTYEVSYVGTIDSTDWSRLQATADNRITITTCLANQPEKRVVVQAIEK